MDLGLQNSSDDEYEHRSNMLREAYPPKYNIESQKQQKQPTRLGGCFRKTMYYGMIGIGVLGITIAILYLFIGVYQTAEDTKTLSGLTMNLMIKESQLQNQENELAKEVKELEAYNMIGLSNEDEIGNENEDENVTE